MAKRILILTAKTGGGHESVAKALKEMLGKQFEVHIYNGLPHFMAKAYFYIHQYLPTLFNLSYRLTDNKLGAKTIHLLNFILTLKFIKKIPFDNYHLILSVQPLLTSEVAWLTNKPLIVFVTDPVTIHQTYLCPRAVLTFTPTQLGKKLCIKKGLTAEKIVVAGFPIRRQFFKKYSQPKSRKKTVFIGGSGYGLRETKAVVNQITNPNFQLIVVCGHNQELKKTLANQKNIRVFGYVKKIAKLMNQSCLIVGKAGANLLFESIVLGVPFLATGYPPEQEKGNLKLIRKYQIGLIEKDPKKAAKLIEELVSQPQKLKPFTKNINKLTFLYRQAPEIISSTISHLLKN